MDFIIFAGRLTIKKVDAHTFDTNDLIQILFRTKQDVNSVIARLLCVRTPCVTKTFR